jgi:hypothetical protein
VGQSHGPDPGPVPWAKCRASPMGQMRGQSYGPDARPVTWVKSCGPVLWAIGVSQLAKCRSRCLCRLNCIDALSSPTDVRTCSILLLVFPCYCAFTAMLRPLSECGDVGRRWVPSLPCCVSPDEATWPICIQSPFVFSRLHPHAILALYTCQFSRTNSPHPPWQHCVTLVALYG